MARFTELGAYLASLPDAPAATVEACIEAVQAGHPDAVVKMAWNVPHLQIDGKYVIGFSAAKHHVSINPWSAGVMAQFSDRLAAYDPTEHLFRVPHDWSIDANLLNDLVDARLAEL